MVQKRSRVEKIGKGNIGGKARGIHFLHEMFKEDNFADTFLPHRLLIPETTVIGTGVFFDFIEQNNLRNCVSEKDDGKVIQRFLKAQFPDSIKEKLIEFLKEHTLPLAVRSSSLHEDSFCPPFAGLYLTTLLPNNHPDIEERCRQLIIAVKMVYASTYFEASKKYIKHYQMAIENEYMAVILQTIVGKQRGNYYYPYCSGVVQNYNFFPLGRLNSSDGICQLVVGLGNNVVGGGNVVRFCPKHPTIRPDFYQPKDVLRNSQKNFSVLDMTVQPQSWETLLNGNVISLPKSEFPIDFFSDMVLSTYQSEEQMFYDRIMDEGTKVVTFNRLLRKDAILPLTTVLESLLEKGLEALHTPMVMEFAVEVEMIDCKPTLSFYCLQFRAQGIAHEEISEELKEVTDKQSILVSKRASGNGRYQDIEHIVYVHPDTFDPQKTSYIATEIAQLNEHLEEENQQYLLVGPGRWGSSNSLLGIPITFNNISQVKVIIELGIKKFDISPSQGTHFFHNLTAANIGFMAISEQKNDEYIDFSWFQSQNIINKLNYVSHIKLSPPFPKIIIDGVNRTGVMVK